jgi:hypothetical protein
MIVNIFICTENQTFNLISRNIYLKNFVLPKRMGKFAPRHVIRYRYKVSTITFNVPEIATVAAIERGFCDLFNGVEDYVDEIVLDFRTVWFIEPSTSTSYLIAMLYTCNKKGYKFRIIPPKNNGVKIVLYSWRFFEVLEEITAIPISEFAPDIKREFSRGIEFRLGSTINKTLKYYQDIDTSEIQSFFKKKYLGQDSVYFLTAYEKFFPLLSLNFSTNEFKQQEFINEKRRWKNAELINHILNNNFNNIEIKDEISEDVISETISNAIIHSNASKFFTGSFFPFSDNQPDENEVFYFTINFWDNGESIIDTLGLPLKNNQNVKSLDAEKHFQLVTKNKNQIEFLLKKKGQYIEDLFTASSDLHPNLDEEHILLAAFFPGVSRLPNRQPDLFNPFPAGIGLSYLTNTVINKLSGEIAIRTKKYFLNIRNLSNYDKDQYIKNFKISEMKKPKRKEIFDENSTYYSAKFTEYDNRMPEFIGNMVTIRIPLRYRKDGVV